MTDNILWESNVGSHMWGMNTPKSDLDLFQVYVRPTSEVLVGKTIQSKFVTDKEKGIDYAIHEIGEVTHQIYKGNINFVLGLTSPIINYATRWFYELYGTFVHNKSKNIFHSIRGLVYGNYTKYVISGLDASEKRQKTILRILEFGIRFLSEGKIEYLPPETDITNTDAIPNMLAKLDEAYNRSSLPVSPDERLYDDFLARLRGDF